MKPKVFLLFLYLISFYSFSQSNSSATLTYDFNQHEIKEKDEKVGLSYSGIHLTEDRFGNEKSAVQLRGDRASYLSLGTSPLLKSPNMTISFWVNLYRRNYMGCGNDDNPLLMIKNGPGEDFINAIVVVYNPDFNCIGAVSTKDSTMEVVALDSDPFIFNTWYHCVVICNNDYLALYINGILKQKTKKSFETKFLETDSMVIGHTASRKNERMSIGVFDDIQIFHRTLSDEEIRSLFEAPDPNEFNALMDKILKLCAVIIFLVVAIIFLLIRNKRALKKQREQLELRNRISELEIKVIKAQMNPHFISNSLAAIQNLILQREIDKASQYLAKFSYFLRQVLDYSERTYITLEEELSIIKMNVELEQLRFKDNFTFSLVVEESINTSDFLIPSLITHPFIENAIWHGFLTLEERSPKLDVRVYREDDLVYVSIEDNGVGRKNSETPGGRRSMGTKLAIDKIENINLLRNNTDFSLEIIDLFDENKNPCGTKVIIRLTHNAY